MKIKHLKKIILILVIFIIGIISLLIFFNSRTDLRTVYSQAQLNRLYDGDTINIPEFIISIPTMPWSFLYNIDNSAPRYDYGPGIIPQSITSSSSSADSSLNSILDTAESFVSSPSSKDYSTTNIQVENVDEADITKTDGNYIYSLSDNDVIITNVEHPENIKISSKISVATGNPEDLILFDNKLVIISEEGSYSNANTIVDIYNIENKENPIRVKNYTLYEPYYTSRAIGNKLYVIASGRLRKEADKIVTYYNEDNKQMDLKLENMHYLKDIETNIQTLISTVNLDNPTDAIDLQSYLIDISNAYVSEKNIYLLDTQYAHDDSDVPPISSLFTLKGAIGPFVYDDEDSPQNNYETKLYKFNIQEDGSIQYSNKTKLDGQIINQFSLDEYDGNLRIALYDKNGSKVIILDDNLTKIGETSSLAKGEKMYSSRFMGNKAYLVTYKTIDPLYVIDLSNPTNPTVLGELKIPGYSTYLHPYDENHLIGIGMQTKETVRRNSFGRVTSTSATITGMKMALFDVSNVNKPIQISDTIIGDSRTTSAILTNHKALLFSKEKELIAIPVNNYAESFEITNSSEDYSSAINSYTNYNKKYLSEGYLVYNINLKDGFHLKGKIVHEGTTSSKSSYNSNTRLLRGLYIEDNLFTISEDFIKVNRLDNLDLINQLNIKTGISNQSSSTRKTNSIINSQEFNKKEEN